mmetsp:Transcript_137013/g.341583  ORF Transcript_137013/g.341583 Transcript_137013/m.341583 type:complete len:309 (-) Transcript_137013:75-1001(-)
MSSATEAFSPSQGAGMAAHAPARKDESSAISLSLWPVSRSLRCSIHLFACVVHSASRPALPYKIGKCRPRPCVPVSDTSTSAGAPRSLHQQLSTYKPSSQQLPLIARQSREPSPRTIQVLPVSALMVNILPKDSGQKVFPASSSRRHFVAAWLPWLGPRTQSLPSTSRPQSHVPCTSLSAAISDMGTRWSPSEGPSTLSQRLCLPTAPEGRQRTPPSPSTPHMASSSASSCATSPPFIMCHQAWLLYGSQPHLANKKCSFLMPPTERYSRSQTTQIARDEASTSTGVPQTRPQGGPARIVHPSPAVGD